MANVGPEMPSGLMSGRPDPGLKPREKLEKGAVLKSVVRVLPIPLLALGMIAAWQPPDCVNNVCPAYALANPWILRSERGLFAVLVPLLVLMVVIRLIVTGEMPEYFGREGFGWKSKVLEVNDSIEDLEKSLKTLNADFLALKGELSNKGVI